MTHSPARAGQLYPASAVSLSMDTSQASSAIPRPHLDVPFVPTPQEVIDAMLDLSRVGRDDMLVDLGCGDGRIVIGAARRGARATGIDLNPLRVTEARENARLAGVEARVTFREGDLYEADVSPATVVTLYLLPTVNLRLRARLWRQLAVGTRVVSHAFDMGPDWPAERMIDVDERTIYFWTISEVQKRAGKA